ncbi:MAG TPA: Zn-ribbon domain-containing OB-fold protein [Acidimicrobiales bacterium]|jgi:hypothetical protein
MANASYLPEEFQVIYPTNLTEEFWDRCNRQELAFQRCSDCGTFRHPPMPFCYNCHSFATEWVPVSGEGTVFTFTIVTHPLSPSLSEVVPYNVALVEFPDAPGVRLASNVVDAEPEEMKTGMAVRLHWEGPINGQTMPRFEKA